MGKQAHVLEKQEEIVLLDAAGIDRLSALLTRGLEQAAVNRKDVIRLRLAAEELLGLWQVRLGEETVCTFRCGTRLGRMYLEITAPGQRIDPEETAADMAGRLLCSNLLAQAGLSPVYSYQDGINRIALYPSRPQKLSPLLQLLLAILAAAAMGAVLLALPAPVEKTAAGVVDPLFSALMGILQTLASPMIFLSVCWGILNIGDVHMLGRIGKTVLLRFLGGVFLLTSVSAAVLVWFFRSGSGDASMGENAAAQIYSMLLGIIPGNIVTPFLEGNSLQIIFMAICIGLVLLVLGEKTSALCVLLGQVNTAVQFMMEAVSRYIPLFVFVSLLSLTLSDAMSNLGGVVKALLLGIAACAAWPLLYALWAEGISFAGAAQAAAHLPDRPVHRVLFRRPVHQSGDLRAASGHLGTHRPLCRPSWPGGVQDRRCGGLFCTGPGTGGILRRVHLPALGGHRRADGQPAGHCRPAGAGRQPDLLYRPAHPAGYSSGGRGPGGGGQRDP